MKTWADLLGQTTAFFDAHWNCEQLGADRPTWSKWETFLEGSVPNAEYGGCYALFAGDDLLYVGVGISKGGGTYPNCGISRRLMSHVICADKKRGRGWAKLREQWADPPLTAICTIGFPHERVYLAAALEGYLIRRLDPPRNRKV